MLVSRHMQTIQSSFGSEGESVSLGHIVSQMKHSGFGLVILFLCLPFLQPIPLAGLSTALGSAILILGAQLVQGRKHIWLPRFIESKTVESKTGKALISAAVRFFKVAEKFVKPRLNALAIQERLIGVMICIMAAFLMLPLPVPFSNLACALPIAILACGLLEKDGLMVVVGMIFSVLGMAFNIAILVLGKEGAMMVWDALV